MAAPREFLFVYGKHARFVGRAYFRGELFYLGEYPGAIASLSPSDRVVGELHRIVPGQEAALFAELDRYKGWNPDRPSERQFVRERVWIESEVGDRVETWT